MNRIKMGKLSLVVIGIEMEAIESFFHSVMDSVKHDIKDIVKRHENGEF